MASNESLEGDIATSSLGGVAGSGARGEEELNTLDEPVKDTIKRDVAAIGQKFFHVLYPKSSKMLLREWDLWGPLILCIFLAVMLQSKGGSGGQKDISSAGVGIQFAEVFIIYWCGAAVVTLNIKLLGGAISFFQSICVLGYCVLPLALSLILCSLLRLADPTPGPSPGPSPGPAPDQAPFNWASVLRCIVVLLAFAWSTFASTAFLADCQPPRRKPLAVYPIFLFYFFIGWLVLLP